MTRKRKMDEDVIFYQQAMDALMNVSTKENVDPTIKELLRRINSIEMEKINAQTLKKQNNYNNNNNATSIEFEKASEIFNENEDTVQYTINSTNLNKNNIPRHLNNNIEKKHNIKDRNEFQVNYKLEAVNELIINHSKTINSENKKLNKTLLQLGGSRKHIVNEHSHASTTFNNTNNKIKKNTDNSIYQDKFRISELDVIPNNNIKNTINIKGNNQIFVKPKSFICSTCQMEFSRSSDLRRHEKIHLSILPNICTQCGKGFGRKDSLKRHFNTLACKRNRIKSMTQTNIFSTTNASVSQTNTDNNNSPNSHKNSHSVKDGKGAD